MLYCNSTSSPSFLKINFIFNILFSLYSLRDRWSFVVFGNSNRIPIDRNTSVAKNEALFRKRQTICDWNITCEFLIRLYLNKTSPAQSLYLVTLAWDSATMISRVIAFFLRTSNLYLFASQCDSLARFDIAYKIVKITSKSPWFPSGWKVKRPWL